MGWQWKAGAVEGAQLHLWGFWLVLPQSIHWGLVKHQGVLGLAAALSSVAGWWQRCPQLLQSGEGEQEAENLIIVRGWVIFNQALFICTAEVPFKVKMHQPQSAFLSSLWQGPLNCCCCGFQSTHSPFNRCGANSLKWVAYLPRAEVWLCGFGEYLALYLLVSHW